MKFTNLLKSLIIEASRYEVLWDKYVKKPKDKENLSPKEKENLKIKIPKEVFFELIETDPTSNLNDVDLTNASPDDFKKVKVGAYTPWLIKQYLTIKTEREPGTPGYEAELRDMRSRFMEDLYKLPDELRKFERFKGKLPLEQRDINKLTIHQVEDLMAPFKLEKTKGTATEKEEAKRTFEYPGSEVVFRGSKWTVVKIEDCGDIAKDAAAFFGGYMLKSGVNETSWCTSSTEERWNQFNYYCKQGPLYVILPNTDSAYGEKTGLPANRFQFHFPSNQFMDKNDRGINLIEYLNGPMQEIKEYFKKEFAKGLTSTSDKSLKISDFQHGNVGKFVGLYGLKDLFENLPLDLEEITISVPDNTNINIELPPSIGKFKNLVYLSLKNCVTSIPPQICECKNLSFVSLIDNPNLRSLPECMAHLPKLQILGLKGSDKVFDNLSPDFYRDGVNVITVGGQKSYIDFSELNPESE